MDLRVKQVDLTAKFPNFSRIRSSLKTNAAPVFGDELWQYLFDNVVPISQFISTGCRHPQICLAELLQPHLQVVQAVATWEIARGQQVIGIAIRSGLFCECLALGCHDQAVTGYTLTGYNVSSSRQPCGRGRLPD
jgi:hypothetical protein